MELTVGITGASGVQYGIRLLQVLNKLNVKTLSVLAEDEIYLKNINTPNELKEISHDINY